MTGQPGQPVAVGGGRGRAAVPVWGTFMSEERPPSPGLPLPLTPSAFLEAVAARLDRLHGADAYPVLLRGVPVRTGATSRVYGGFVYAEVRDPRTTDGIAARVPEQLAATLER